MPSCGECSNKRPVPVNDGMSKHGFVLCCFKPSYDYQSPTRQVCERWSPEKEQASTSVQSNQLF